MEENGEVKKSKLYLRVEKILLKYPLNKKAIDELQEIWNNSQIQKCICLLVTIFIAIKNFQGHLAKANADLTNITTTME